MTVEDVLPFAYLAAGGALVASGYWLSESLRRCRLRARRERRLAYQRAVVDEGRDTGVPTIGHRPIGQQLAPNAPTPPRSKSADPKPPPGKRVA